MSKTNLTVIIPVHSVADTETKTFDELFDTALSSISSNSIKPEKVLIVRCNCMDVDAKLSTMDLSKYDLDNK